MQKVVACPDCHSKLKVTVQETRDVRVKCPKCQKKLVIAARSNGSGTTAGKPAAPSKHTAEKPEKYEEPGDEMSEDLGLDFGDGYGEQDYSEGSEEAQTSGTEFDEQWDEFGNAIDKTRKKKSAAKEPESDGMPFIRTPLMDRDDYKNPDDEIKNPVLRSLYAVSAVLFSNVYMGFAVIVLATCLVIVLPLWALNKQWRKDSGVEDGDEIRMFQTLGNAKTVSNGIKEVYNGESGLQDDVNDIKELNKQAEQARKLNPDGRAD